MGCGASKTKQEGLQAPISKDNKLNKEPTTTSLPSAQDKKANKAETKTKGKQNQTSPVADDVTNKRPTDNKTPNPKSNPKPTPKQGRKEKAFPVVKLPPKKNAKVVVNDDDRPLTQAKGIANKCWWDNDDNEETDQFQDDAKEPTESNSSLSSSIGSPRKCADVPFKANKGPASKTTPLVDRLQQGFSANESNDTASDEVTLEDVDAYEQRINPTPRKIDWDSRGTSPTHRARGARIGNTFNDSIGSNGVVSGNGCNGAFGGSAPFDNDLSATSSHAISSPRPKFKRPAPLKRGAGAAAVRRPVQQIGPTKASVEKILDKLNTLDDSRWSELIKAHTELCNTAQKHQSILLQCDQKLFLNTVRQVTVHTNSGRSNVSKHGLMCLGLLFKVFKDQLTPVLNDALCACIKRTASSSNEFITKASTIALIQICTASSADKIIPFLLHQYNVQKSFQIPVLQGLLIVINGIEGDIGRSKYLNDVVNVTIKSLTAANATVRTFSRNLLGVLDGKCDLQSILKTMHLSADTKLNANAILSKYKESDKNKVISKLMEGT